MVQALDARGLGASRLIGAGQPRRPRHDPRISQKPHPPVPGRRRVGVSTLCIAEPEDLNRRLWTHIHALSPRCQALLRVIAYSTRPDYATISAALGMPVGSIGPTRGRCLATLRRSLASDPAWSPA